MFVFLIGWIFIHVLTKKKVFSPSLPKWLLTILLLGRSCRGALPYPPVRSPGGAIAVRSTVLLWKPHWSSHSPELALQVPLGPVSGTTPSPYPPPHPT